MTKQKTSYICPNCGERQSKVNLEQKVYSIYQIDLKTKYSEAIDVKELNDDVVYVCPECKEIIKFEFIKNLL